MLNPWLLIYDRYIIWEMEISKLYKVGLCSSCSLWLARKRNSNPTALPCTSSYWNTIFRYRRSWITCNCAYFYLQVITRYTESLKRRQYKASTIYNHLLDINRWSEYIACHESRTFIARKFCTWFVALFDFLMCLQPVGGWQFLSNLCKGVFAVKNEKLFPSHTLASRCFRMGVGQKVCGIIHHVKLPSMLYVCRWSWTTATYVDCFRAQSSTADSLGTPWPHFTALGTCACQDVSITFLHMHIHILFWLMFMTGSFLIS